MFFNIALLTAAVNCLAVQAAPVDPAGTATSLAPGPEFLFAPNGPGYLRTKSEVYAALEKLVAESGTGHSADKTVRQLSTREMTPGKKYTWGTWVVVAGQVIVEQYTGTDFHFPTDASGIGKICNDVASSLTNTIGNGSVQKAVAGGWSWKGQILQNNYEFNGIPYNLVYGLVYDAIQAASGWITFDNAFDFIIHDTDKKAIMELQVFPTVHGAVSSWHDEL